MTIFAGTSAREVIYWELKPSLLLRQFRHGLRVANGIHDVASGRLVYLPIANFTSTSRPLPKMAVFTYATRNPLALLVPDEETKRYVSADLHIPTKAPAKISVPLKGRTRFLIDLLREKRKKSLHQKQDRPRPTNGVMRYSCAQQM